MQLRRALGMVRELAEDVAGQIRGLREVVDLHLHDLTNLVFELRIGREDANHGRQELTRRTLEDRLGQPLLAAEVVVQQRGIHAGFLRNLLRAGPGRASPHEHGMGGVEDPLLGLLGAGRPSLPQAGPLDPPLSFRGWSLYQMI